MNPVVSVETARVKSFDRVDSILEVLLRFSDPTPPVLGSRFFNLSSIAAEHRQKVETAIAAQKPIRFVLPAFPAKSPNREKTIGDSPDLAEFLALRRLNRFCREIGQWHRPGAEAIICSDGRVFSDLVAVSDEKITDYSRSIERIIERHGFWHLSTFHLENVFPAESPDDLRSRLLELHATPADESRERIREESSMQRLFNGMHRFIFEDRVVLESGKSRQRIRNESKEIAYELIRRSEAWGRLLEEQFPEAIRMSIHPQAPLSRKWPVRLLPSEDAWRTPWHSVVLLKDGHVVLVPRKQAEALGAELRSFEGEFSFYAVPGESIEEALNALT